MSSLWGIIIDFTDEWSEDISLLFQGQTDGSVKDKVHYFLNVYSFSLSLLVLQTYQRMGR